jgi:hypothetical protein
MICIIIFIIIIRDNDNTRQQHVLTSVGHAFPRLHILNIKAIIEPLSPPDDERHKPSMWDLSQQSSVTPLHSLVSASTKHA